MVQNAVVMECRLIFKNAKRASQRNYLMMRYEVLYLNKRSTGYTAAKRALELIIRDYMGPDEIYDPYCGSCERAQQDYAEFKEEV